MSKIKKWGNSLALRIPKAYAEELSLKEGTPVKISTEKGKLIIEPKKKYTLDELVDGITPENTHKGDDKYIPRKPHERYCDFIDRINKNKE